MTVGFQPASKADIDTRAGVLATQVRDLFGQVEQFQAWLSGIADATLTAAPYGYSQADVTLLKSAFTQLDQLRVVATGGAAQAAANNFLFFSDQIARP